MDSKKPWESKTIWLNIIVAVAAFFPAVKDFIGNNPEAVIQGLNLVSIILRVVSNDKIVLKDEPKVGV